MYADFFFRTYLHYETFDRERMEPATDDQIGLGINTWCLTWPMTQDKMYLQDVANQDMVNRHAKDDKWVTLPLEEPTYVMPCREPRTQAEHSAKPSDYIGRYGYGDTPKTNVFNEPVCFFRVMKVKDKGGKNPNLVSTDGRRLTIVHLLNDAKAYELSFQGKWAHNYSTNTTGYFVDNKLYGIPAISGLEYLVIKE